VTQFISIMRLIWVILWSLDSVHKLEELTLH